MKIKILLLSLISIYSSVLSFGQTWQWASIEGNPAWDEAPLICPDNKGGSFISGNYYGTFELQGQNIPFTTWSAHFLAKLDGAGQLVWVKPYGNHMSHCVSITADQNGNLYMCGYWQGASINIDGTILNADATHGNWFFAKYDNNGTLLWIKNDIVGVEVKNLNLDGQGSLNIAGVIYPPFMKFNGVTYNCDTSASTSAADGFIARYDASGNAAWAKSFTGPNTDQVTNIGSDASNNIYITGSFNSNKMQIGGSGSPLLKKDTTSTGGDLFIAKYNSSGAFQWVRSAGGNGITSESAPALTVDNAGNITVITDFRLDTLTVDNIVTIHGKSWCTETAIIRYDKDGLVKWGNSSDGNLRIQGADITYFGSDVYFAGAFGDYITSTTPTLTSNGNFDTYIAKMDASGNWKWGVSFGGDGNDMPFNLNVDSYGGLYISSMVYSTLINLPMTTLFGVGQADFFYGKLAINVGIDEYETTAHTFSISPNPMTSSSILFFKDRLVNAEITVYDLLGKIKRTESFTGNIMRIQKDDLESGVYFIHVKNGGREEVQKLVVQ